MKRETFRQLMDSLSSEIASAPAPVVPASRPPRIWKFWGTALWGLLIFAAMFAGQMAVVAWFVLRREGPFDMAAAIHVVGGGLTISLSVITGLPAVLAALWLAIRRSRTPFADYLALRGTSWVRFSDRRRRAGRAGDGVGPAVARDGTRGHAGIYGGGAAIGARRWRAMAVWWSRSASQLPSREELFARGFLYRGWSESFLRVPGAILLSSLVWTSLHLQYDWFFFGEVFSIGLLLGYLRYRFHSTWLDDIVHGLNNLAAVVQTLVIAGGS